MNSDEKLDPTEFLIGMFVSLVMCILMFWFAMSQENGLWKREAIKTGNAKYNEKTSSFEWIDHSGTSVPQLSEKDE